MTGKLRFKQASPVVIFFFSMSVFLLRQAIAEQLRLTISFHNFVLQSILYSLACLEDMDGYLDCQLSSLGRQEVKAAIRSWSWSAFSCQEKLHTNPYFIFMLSKRRVGKKESLVSFKEGLQSGLVGKVNGNGARIMRGDQNYSFYGDGFKCSSNSWKGVGCRNVR